MAGTRTYYRTSGGKFAGASGAAKVTTGKAGGFANASFRQRVIASRGNARPGKPAGQKASPSKSLGGAAGAKGLGSRGSKTARGGLTVKQKLATAAVGSATGLIYGNVYTALGGSTAVATGVMVAAGVSAGKAYAGSVSASNRTAAARRAKASTRKAATSSNARPKIAAGRKVKR